jgi:TRAP-type C4-dicarboxylate transport system permease small subunit
MKKILKKLSLVLSVLALALAVTFSIGGLVQAAPSPNKDEVCKGIEATGGDCDTGEDEINNLVASIINVFSWVVGVVAVIMVIYGGFEYVTSGGDSAKAAKGRTTILFALVGLVIVVLAQVLVKFVLNKATGK